MFVSLATGAEAVDVGSEKLEDDVCLPYRRPAREMTTHSRRLIMLLSPEFGPPTLPAFQFAALHHGSLMVSRQSRSEKSAGGGTFASTQPPKLVRAITNAMSIQNRTCPPVPDNFLHFH